MPQPEIRQPIHNMKEQGVMVISEGYNSESDDSVEPESPHKEVDVEVHCDESGSVEHPARSVTVIFPRAQLRNKEGLSRTVQAERTLSMYLQELLDIGQASEVVLRDLPDVVTHSEGCKLPGLIKDQRDVSAKFDFSEENVARRQMMDKFYDPQWRVSCLEVEIPPPEEEDPPKEEKPTEDLTGSPKNDPLTPEVTKPGKEEEWNVPQALLMEYVFQWNPLVAEIEAVEACRWLRAAGFPQYAQMYEDQLFPVDIQSVEKDHDFLDKDSLQSLFRRLNTLNKCVTMKIEAPSRKANDDSDDDDSQCALSDKWRYQRNSRRWSRKDLLLAPPSSSSVIAPPSPESEQKRLRSSSSRDSVITDNEESQVDSPLTKTEEHSHILSNKVSNSLGGHVSDSDTSASSTASPLTPSIRRAASEKFRGAKNFLRRMESLKSRKAKPTKANLTNVQISPPVLVDSKEVQQRMDQLGCVDLTPQSTNQPSPQMAHLQKQTRCLELQTLSSDSDPSGSPSAHKKASHSQAVPSPTPMSRHNRSHSDFQEGYHLGPDYVPGSFPKLRANGCIDTGNGGMLNCRTGSFNMGSESQSYREKIAQRAKGQSDKVPGHGDSELISAPPAVEQRVSVYDNVGEDPELDFTHVNPQDELDRILQELYQNISGLDQTLEMSAHEDTSLQDEGKGSSSPHSFSTLESQMKDSNTHKDTSRDMVGAGMIPKDLGLMLDLDPDLLNYKDLASDPGTPASREEDTSDLGEIARERRDSGVGSSLTRVSSEYQKQRIRWHSFIKSHRPTSDTHTLQLSAMSAGQLMVLRKLSLLKVTALMEKYSPSNRSGWNWIMPKFMKRWKTPDYSRHKVFGVPLLVVLQRTGQPLPQCMLRAMRCLRRTALDAVGIFRKSGVRSRIQKLRDQIEVDPESVDFESLQSYDVADLLKQYFRELPECLLTNKLSETFISIFTHMPSEVWLEALQAVIMLLPDENRQVLQSLLFFLYDMASHAHENQMNASNLAVCFAPSLFHMCGANRGGSNTSSSPKRLRKQTGIPDQKELLDQKAAHLCLTHMIAECKQLFQVPEDMLSKCRLPYIEEGNPVSLEELGGHSYNNKAMAPVGQAEIQMENAIQGLLKESRDRWKGWVSVSSLTLPTQSGVEVAYKKVGDGYPLRLWKACIEVEAPPEEVLNRVLRERHLWDEDLLQWRIVEKLSSDMEVFQYQLASMAPHPTIDICELRCWKTRLSKGACVLVSTSVEHPGATQLRGVRGVVLASRFLIEPCGAGKSRLTHVCRIDYRGQTAEWYNRCFGRLCANQLVRIRDSFSQAHAGNDGPETKV